MAHFSDLVKTAVKGVNRLAAESIRETPTLQIFQRTLVDVSFLLGYQLDRWKRIQLYNRIGDSYQRLMTLDPK